jgi:phage-related protein
MSEPGDNLPVLSVMFFANSAGNEPVREWLLALAKDHRRSVGHDIKTAQYGWPLGMPLIRKLEPGLWEVRSRIGNGIARVLFTVDGHGGRTHYAVASGTREEVAEDAGRRP